MSTNTDFDLITVSCVQDCWSTQWWDDATLLTGLHCIPRGTCCLEASITSNKWASLLGRWLASLLSLVRNDPGRVNPLHHHHHHLSFSCPWLYLFPSATKHSHPLPHPSPIPLHPFANDLACLHIVSCSQLGHSSPVSDSQHPPHLIVPSLTWRIENDVPLFLSGEKEREKKERKKDKKKMNVGQSGFVHSFCF